MTLQGGLLLVWHGPLRARLAALAVRGQLRHTLHSDLLACTDMWAHACMWHRSCVNKPTGV